MNHATLTQANQIAAGENYLILVPRTIYIPGDERSVTNPGHGYPASNEQTWSVQSFQSKDEWEAEIKRRVLVNDKDFVPIVANRPEINVSTDVSVSKG